ncbi:MAG: hypothetical protein ACXWKP_29940 [Bradyrhizobium sp.]
MSQLSTAIFGAMAIALSLSAAQFAAGRDFYEGQQKPPGVTEATINRGAKADRAVRAVGPAEQTQTVSLRLEGLSDTSVVVRIPVTQEARSGPAVRSITKSPDRKLRTACEPVVSVLTEVAKQLQPGRCVT